MDQENIVKRSQKQQPLPQKGGSDLSGHENYSEDRLHVIQRLVKNPSTTYYFEMENDELAGFGILKGALLVVDRNVSPKSGCFVVVNHENSWITRQMIVFQGRTYLNTANIMERPIQLRDEESLIFGVVIWSCNPLAGNGIHSIVNRIRD